jgi:peptidoglycan/xylan/chitin deacetylase (PgdA/CDA1 family)
LGSWLTLVRRQPLKIPVLNYHSVSADPEWLQIGEQVSLAPAALERQLAYLERHGYRSLFVSEVHRVLTGDGRREPRGKFVALTFDDGYADNWIAAFPLLKKYGVKATLFVSTSFISEAEGCRPTLDEEGKPGQGALDWSGYLTWPELKAMQVSGLIEVQSHACTHTRVFAESGLQGFVGPYKPNLWLLWNARPESRTSWWRAGETNRSLWGHPVYQQAPALAHRAYRPDAEAVAHMLTWAKGAAVSEAADWERRAREAWDRYARNHAVRGEWESASDYEQRVEMDLETARRTLAEKLGIGSDILCWPENAFSQEGEVIARRVGYVATVSNRHDSRNAVGEAPGRMARVFIGSRSAGIRCPWLDFAVFVLELKVFEGWYAVYPLLAVMHMSKKAASAVRRRWKCHKDYLSIWD